MTFAAKQTLQPETDLNGNRWIISLNFKIQELFAHEK